MSFGPIHGLRIAQISAGQSHTIAMAEGGFVFTWGGNENGQLGDNTFTGRKFPVQVKDMTFGSEELIATQVAAGNDYSIAIVGGAIYSWGLNDHGQLGDGSTETKPFPDKVDHAFRAVKISAGDTFVLVLDEDGKVYSWGDNSRKQLGISTSTYYVTRPVKIEHLESETIVEISAGKTHAMALNMYGVVFTWGHGDRGQLGLGPTQPGPLLPTPLNSTDCVFKDKKIVQLSAGLVHSVALDDQGKMYSWGHNDWGQLGNGEHVVKNGSGIYNVHWTPMSVDDSNVLNGKYITHISAGYYHTMAMSSDGSVFLFGSNEYSQIGSMDQILSSSPIILRNTTNRSLWTATQIAAGGYHSVFLGSNGAMYSFGDNSFGQLGDGTTMLRSYPTPIYCSPLQEKLIIQLATCKTHSILVTSDGQLFSWGQNWYGQLGDGTNVDKDFPVSVETDGVLRGRQIVQLGVSSYFSVALSRDGQLFSWGDGGKLGDGTRKGRYSPVTVDMNGVLLGKKVVQIAVGLEHTVVLTEDMQLFSWGGNTNGQLGDGTFLNRISPSPVKMGNMTMNGARIRQIVAGNYHTVVRTDRLCFVWGRISTGQLAADQLAINSNTPLQVELGSEIPKLVHAAEDKTMIVTESNKVYSYEYSSSNGFHRIDDFSDDGVELVTSTKSLNYIVSNSSRIFSYNSTGHVSELNTTNVNSNQIISSFFVSETTMSTMLQVTCKKGHFGSKCNKYTCFGLHMSSNNVCSGRGSCISYNTCSCKGNFAGGACSTCKRGFIGPTCNVSLFVFLVLVTLSPILVCSCVLVAFLCSWVYRRKKQDKRIESELHAYLLEEKADLDLQDMMDDRNYFIHMKDIQIMSRLSEGAYGVVYKGQWKSNLVAVKKMKVADDKSFLKEISILQNLRHPNIIYLYGYSSNDNGDKFFIAEFAAQGSLDKHLYGREPLRDFNKKLHMLTQVADAMKYLHTRSPPIAHRDLKPQNILIDEKGMVRICDFGVSKMADSSFTVGVSYGTVEYCAPELLLQQGHDERCDIYSFGILMHEVFVLAHPYVAHESSMSVISLSLQVMNGLRPQLPFDDEEEETSSSSSSNSHSHSNFVLTPTEAKQFFERGNDWSSNCDSWDIVSVVRDYYRLAIQCWHADPACRPSFEEVVSRLEDLARTIT